MGSCDTNGFSSTERKIIIGLLSLLVVILAIFLGLAMAVFIDYKNTCNAYTEPFCLVQHT